MSGTLTSLNRDVRTKEMFPVPYHSTLQFSFIISVELQGFILRAERTEPNSTIEHVMPSFL